MKKLFILVLACIAFSSLLKGQNCGYWGSYSFQLYSSTINFDNVNTACEGSPADRNAQDVLYSGWIYNGTIKESSTFLYNCHWYAWVKPHVVDLKQVTRDQITGYILTSGEYTFLSGATLVNNNYPHPAILLWTGGSDHSAATLNNSK